jgi:hypothetical protein
VIGRGRREGRAERLLAIRLAGTAERRAAEAGEIERLGRAVDYDWLAAGLDGGRLLPLLGSRLVDALPHAVPAGFRAAVDASLTRDRRRATVVEQVALQLARELERAGIRAVLLKGPHLAERLYRDVGMRSSNDIDLLVDPRDFHPAVGVLERLGYGREPAAAWIGDLPLFEASLRAGDGWRPPVDLHWRLHWYEERFSRGFVARSRPDLSGARIAQPVDELAALLLFWCRDGLSGLRHAADVAAWWDRYGGELAPEGLEEIATEQPALRRPLAAAALLAEQAVGVPADRLLAGLDRAAPRMRLALRFANLVEPASDLQNQAGVVAVDALLSERLAARGFVRRHLLLPPAVIGEIFGIPPSARGRRALHRFLYAARRGVRLAWATVAVLTSGRGAMLRGQAR